jgi:3-hydroxymyristoyl/3-hydroxydecanoyl-(acyl carrier protein) dehydratase
MHPPLIKHTSQEENRIELLINFAKEAEYFQGHFPQIAILPGVVQVHYAMECAENYFGIIPEISKINRLRFTNIISPEKDIYLQIEHIKDIGKIMFKYFFGAKIYSSGTIYLRAS